MNKFIYSGALLVLTVASAAAQPAKENDRKDEMTTDEKVRILEEEVEKLRLQKATKTYQSVGGMGPAASSVYRPEEGASIGGYLEAFAADSRSPYLRGTADLERFVVYLGYRFNDWIVLNSEVEYEHAGIERTDVVTDVDFGSRTSKKETVEKAEVTAEFAYVDFKVRDALQFRVGLNLVPIGITNYQHEPTTFYTTARPISETTIIPSTWRELGVLVHGDLDKGRFLYRTGVLTGLDATKFTGSDWIGEDGSYRGSQATFEDLAFVANFDAKATETLTLGATYYAGRAGQGNLPAVTEADRLILPSLSGPAITEQFLADLQTYKAAHDKQAPVLVQIAEAHALFRTGPWDMRALIVRGWMNEEDAKAVNRGTGENIGTQVEGGYAEIGFNVLSLWKTDHRLVVYVREERVNTQKHTVERYAGNRDDVLDAVCSRTGACKTTNDLANGQQDLGYVGAEDSGKELYGVRGVADRTNDRSRLSIGFAYFPHPNVALKFEYARNSSRSNYHRDIELFNPGNNKIDQVKFALSVIY